MKLMVIEGGRCDGGGVVRQRPAVRPIAADVDAEARRRIRSSGYEAWQVRQLATGVCMPQAIRYLQMQIAFAADALARLDHIPDDFRSDIYWPA